MSSSSSIFSISVVDGRYAERCAVFRGIFSEAALIKYRLIVELHWLMALFANPMFAEKHSAKIDADAIKAWIASLNDLAVLESAVKRVKEFEATTNHDVKAVEYYLKESFAARTEAIPAKLLEYIHFALTSEDVNNVAYAAMVTEGRRVVGDKLQRLVSRMVDMAHEHAAVPMISRTHGQPATPTTVGKEVANFVHRLKQHRQSMLRVELAAKMNGAVGNFNAHVTAYPTIDWPAVARATIESLGLGLKQNEYTTQIEPHDSLAELFDAMSRVATTGIDICRDFWGYISLGYFKLKVKKDEVGSSAMPHKVNPIDFENAEGNFGLAIALLEHMARKLPISRFQRDLSDSTVLRNIGTAFALFAVAVDSLSTGIDKLTVNETALADDLEHNWEVLAEPIQTVMRAHGLETPYEKLKELTRGKKVTREIMQTFISGLGDLPADARAQLLALTPHTYTGHAAQLALAITKEDKTEK